MRFRILFQCVSRRLFLRLQNYSWVYAIFNARLFFKAGSEVIVYAAGDMRKLFSQKGSL